MLGSWRFGSVSEEKENKKGVMVRRGKLKGRKAWATETSGVAYGVLI